MRVVKKKHVPMRTCVSCGAKSAKRSLLRIVATPDEGVDVDASGRANGRGAYVCRDGSCGPSGLQRGRVEHALRTRMTDDSWVELIESLKRTLETVG